MKNPLIIGIVGTTLLTASAVFAVSKKDKETPPWMEDVKVKGRSTYLVPKGAKRDVIGSQVVVEPPNEYVARRIYEIENYLEERFKEIETGQKELKSELEKLKEALKEIEEQIEVNKQEQSE